MPAQASVESTGVSLSRPSANVGVFRFDADAGGYEYLPNIRILTIQFREGADAGVARFRYVFNALDDPTVPRSFADVMSVDSDLPGVVANDDRLVVLASNPDGSPQVLFDGFAQVPELALSSRHELVTFLAFGVAIREWDVPISGAYLRNADNPTVVADTETNLVARFNPQGRPNATPLNADASNDDGETYPTFLDLRVVRNPDIRRLWTLPMAVRYLCYHHNPDEDYVKNPDGGLIDQILDARSPSGPDAAFLPSTPGAFDSDPLIVPDYLASGKAWPSAVRDLLKANGFGMVFRVGTDDSGLPTTSLDLFRRQDASSTAMKDLYLQSPATQLDPGQSNLAEAQLARDMSGVANAIAVEPGLVRYEASFILAPGFAIKAADAATSGAIAAFDRNGSGFASNHDAYRLYVLDETGEGHWDPIGVKLATSAPDLGALFVDASGNKIPYAVRRRPAIGPLFSTDANQKPLEVRLSISTDYQGTQPGLWDGTGTWQPVGGGYELLKDRLGIWISAPSPNSWNIQASKSSNAPYPSGVVKAVEDQVATSGPKFKLRLTCVVEGDQAEVALADRRPSSPTRFQVVRRVDARDRYAKQVIAGSSEFNTSGKTTVARDDGDDAMAEALSRRSTGESGEVAGSVVIPRFTQAYRIGDRIRSIQGRNLSLRTNAGAPTEEGEVYPAVVGLTWDFEGDQRTILQLSDQRGEGR